MRTLEEGLEKFTLVSGTAGDGKTTACETSLLNWLWGEDKWGDALSCAHPIIRDRMINHNDAEATTTEERVEAVRLGMTGALDTWWVPIEVVIEKLSVERGTDPPLNDRLVALLTGVAAWKENKVRASLNRANLYRANLDGASLDGANLNRANLNRANLIGASLDGASLDGANLNRANLYRANLYRANLNRANLDGANLDGASLDGASLDGASLDGASLIGASLDGASLDGASLDGASLYRANLNRANLIGASLIGANLYRANLYRANLYRALYLENALNLDKTIGEPASLPTGWEYKNGLIVKK